MSSPALTPFEIALPQPVLDDLAARLARTRFAPDLANDDWEYGFNGDYLRELTGYWARDFDWRATERQMNEWSHYRLDWHGQPIHLVHQRGKGPSPMPLLLHHGWPWTFWDLKRVIGPLTDPAAHGGDPRDAFDVVLLSLPGYGFSSPLTQTGWNFHTTADLEAELMTRVLGYERFATAGGDWGALVVGQLGHKHADKLIGLYCHLPIQLSHYLADHPDVPPGIAYRDGLPEPSEYGPDEDGWVARNEAFFAKESGYGYLQLSKPQTLAASLNDSPAGQLAWIIEKRRTWADTHSDLESVWDRDHLCATATLYWATQTGGSSARFYKEALLNPWRPSFLRFPMVEAPTALGVYPADVLLMPKRWSERYYNLKQYRVHPRGGHFAPYECPDLFVGDLRDFFRGFRR
ncbi:MAG: epoxide hydrolase family protein [Gammaproteobacteria bacterium]